MIVEVPLPLAALPEPPTLVEVRAALAAHYADERFVEVASIDGGRGAENARPGGFERNEHDEAVRVRP